MKVLLLFKPNTPIVNIQQNIIPNGLLYIGALLLSRNIDEYYKREKSRYSGD
jgi:hypothetical protein